MAAHFNDEGWINFPTFIMNHGNSCLPSGSYVQLRVQFWTFHATSKTHLLQSTKDWLAGITVQKRASHQLKHLVSAIGDILSYTRVNQRHRDANSSESSSL